jgi:hypothetical protein
MIPNNIAALDPKNSAAGTAVDKNSFKLFI